MSDAFVNLARAVIKDTSTFGLQLPVPYRAALAVQRSPPTPMPVATSPSSANNAIRDANQMAVLADLVLQVAHFNAWSLSIAHTTMEEV